MTGTPPARRAAIVGIGRTAFARRSGRSAQTQAVDAARAALADAGLEAADVDGIAAFQIRDSVAPIRVADALGTAELTWQLDLHGGGDMGVPLMTEAIAAVESGRCSVAVAFRALNGRSGRRFNVVRTPAPIGGESQFGARQGYLGPIQWMAMWARRHQYVYGTTSDDLGAIAMTERAHAVPNPHAVARDPLTIEEYREARWIHEPLRLYDCCQEVDGAVALVVTTLERARHLRHRPVVSLGSAYASSFSWDQWPDMTTMYSAQVGPALWKGTGLRPSDIDVACMYDCYTYTVLCTMEDFGFFPKGQGGDFFREGRATYGGDVVVNPHGGLLSEGYIHGLNHHYEAVLQLRGQAGPRQVPGTDTVLVTAGSGPSGGALVYGGAE